MSGRGIHNNEDHENQLLLLTRIIFPNFISQLVRADQHLLAGFLVTKFMHSNQSLSLTNIAGASLYRYLEIQMQMLLISEFPVEKTCKTTLKNTVGRLRGKLSSFIQSILPLLSARVR